MLLVAFDTRDSSVHGALGIIAYTLRVYYTCIYRTKNFGKYIGL